MSITISERSAARIREAVRTLEAGEGGGGAQGRSASDRGGDIQVVRVTSATPTSGRYPAKVQEYDAAANTSADLGGDCWAVDLNGNALTTGYYEGRRWGEYSGAPVFSVGERVGAVTTEIIQDVLAAAVVDTSTIVWVYNDVTGTLTASWVGLLVRLEGMDIGTRPALNVHHSSLYGYIGATVTDDPTNGEVDVAFDWTGHNYVRRAALWGGY